MAIKEIITPVKERKTEYYALAQAPEGPIHPGFHPLRGPFPSLGQLESSLPPGEYTIVTKVKKVVVS
jgi:hypothetical protein